jgi:TRAP-type C4-dicarboxylate transport system substrate-binding protein
VRRLEQDFAAAAWRRRIAYDEVYNAIQNGVIAAARTRPPAWST